MAEGTVMLKPREERSPPGCVCGHSEGQKHWSQHRTVRSPQPASGSLTILDHISTLLVTPVWGPWLGLPSASPCPQEPTTW